MSHSTISTTNIPAKAIELGDALAHLVFERVDLEDAAPFLPEARRIIGQGLAERLRMRKPGEAQIRIFDLPSGLGRAASVIEILNDDMPFLLDSALAELGERGLAIQLVAHPILAVERDAKGALIRLVGPAQGRELVPVQRESLLHLHIAPLNDEAERASLEASMKMIFSDIRAAVGDWLPMRSRLAEVATRYRAAPPMLPADEIAEAVQFLDWLLAENFTFLGVRDYRFEDIDGAADPIPGQGLGILRDPDVKVLRRGSELVVMTPQIRAFLKEPTPLFVAKANVKSRIHRRVYLDYVGVKLLDASGRLEGELRVVGLFTSTAYTGSTRTIPYLRHKVARVFERAGFDPNSHSGKALFNVLENYPRDELFQLDVETLFTFAMDVLALIERPRLRALARVDRFDRFVSVLVFVPKDRYDTKVRLNIGAYLAQIYGGRVSAAYPAYPEGPLARTHYIIGRSEGPTPLVSREELEAGILAIVTTWSDGFRAHLAETDLGVGTTEIERVYRGAFNAAYREAFDAASAIADIATLERLSPSQPFAFDLYRKAGDPETQASLKVFALSEAVSLSHRVPILENLGFTVISERTYAIQPEAEGRAPVFLHDMTLERGKGGAIDLVALQPALEAALDSIFARTLESDRFNVLITDARLSPREADILRAYARYLRQIGVPYSQIYIADALARYPGATQHLIGLFAIKFDPDHAGNRLAHLETARGALLAEIDKITSLDDDRIFRKMLNLIEASLRTNAYQQVEGAQQPTIAFKFACAAIEALPLPRPLYEIFVSSPQVEGLHLRFGMVARGGLRWTDRPMDFRTEILGLVKAQQVKNAVIVPVGAKGGFFPKRLPPASDRDAWFAEGTSAYKTFVSALLDLTDTILGDAIVPPQRTIRYDGDDAYLVVAADKGTATFSDTANGISEARGHWLGDAFASGGSAGYDHKKMGITARGGWEAVKRHFREMDRDIQSEAFTVAGVGDMSGDVFGNGMLLSEEIRLVAAFDHRDIFLDPAPNARSSFAERKRLFEKPRSSWQDYDKGLISQGGGIFSRSLKKIPLSPEIRVLLDLDQDEASPLEVMSAILRARVDLLWFGGIGTYLRGSAETDAQVGDRANDPIRISAPELRAKVVGEGANLGMTQAARIEAARKGVRINTDAIDNSAGVNSSDVEVNLKIALARPEADGRLTRAARNVLLASMTDEVARLVLRNNYLQSLALSLTQRHGASASPDLIGLMQALEADGRLDRNVELLPTNREIEARMARQEGLTRPELAVLLAYAKLALHDALIASDVPDDPYLSGELSRYFPEEMRKTYPDAIEHHRLKREIVATQLANAIINRGGPAIVTRLASQTGRGAPDIARAYALARDVFGILDINLAVDALDTKIAGNVQLGLYARAEAHVSALMLWFLRNIDFASGSEAVTGLGALVQRFKPGVEKLSGEIESLLDAEQRALRAAQIAALEADKVPPILAARITDMAASAMALDGVLVGDGANVSVSDAVATLFALANALDLTALREKAALIQSADAYERLALDRAFAATEEAQRRIGVQILTDFGAGEAGVSAWIEAKGERFAQAARMIGAIGATPLNQAKLTVLAGLLGDLAKTT